MTNFESLDLPILDDVTGGAELDGAAFCDGAVPAATAGATANQACKTGFAQGAGQAAGVLKGISLFGTGGNGQPDGKGVVFPDFRNQK